MRRLAAVLMLALVACQGAASDLPGAPLPETDPASFRRILGESDRPVVVNVWGSWCLPCRAEAPLLRQAAERYGDRISFIGVATRDAQAPARRFLAEFGITFPNYFDSTDRVAADLGGIGVPRTFFFSPGGDLVKVHNGVIDEQTLALLIDELLSR
jgi:cytochrome c biogenesis protein CcmG/thiol:disulfide interchange protein DsbE